jgi:hypothetical protein
LFFVSWVDAVRLPDGWGFRGYNTEFKGLSGKGASAVQLSMLPPGPDGGRQLSMASPELGGRQLSMASPELQPDGVIEELL